MSSRTAKAFEPPIPKELEHASGEVLFVYRDTMAYRHEMAGRLQESEGRMRALEQSVRALVAAHGKSADAQVLASQEILRRLGRDDPDASYGLTGTVGGLVRAVGTAPDQDGKHGSGLRGDIYQLGQRITPFERIRDAFKVTWPVFLVIAGFLAFLLKDQLAHLLATPVH